MFNRDFEQQALSQLKPKERTFIGCNTCGCHYFERIVATRIDLDVSVSFGQAVPEVDTFHVLKCLRCGDLSEPPLSYTFNNSPEFKQYQKFLDEMQEQKKTQPPVSENKIDP